MIVWYKMDHVNLSWLQTNTVSIIHCHGCQKSTNVNLNQLNKIMDLNVCFASVQRCSWTLTLKPNVEIISNLYLNSLVCLFSHHISFVVFFFHQTEYSLQDYMNYFKSCFIPVILYLSTILFFYYFIIFYYCNLICFFA